MSDDQPIRRRPRTRLVDPNWPFLYSVDPATRGLVTNVPRPAGRVPLVEGKPVGPRKITATGWPFPMDRPALTQGSPAKRVKLRADAISVYDLFPPAPF